MLNLTDYVTPSTVLIATCSPLFSPAYHSFMRAFWRTHLTTSLVLCVLQVDECKEQLLVRSYKFLLNLCYYGNEKVVLVSFARPNFIVIRFLPAFLVYVKAFSFFAESPSCHALEV